MLRLMGFHAWEAKRGLNMALSGLCAMAAAAALLAGAALTAAILMLAALVLARHAQRASGFESSSMGEALLIELRKQREGIEAARLSMSIEGPDLGKKPYLSRAILMSLLLVLEERRGEAKRWHMLWRHDCSPSTWLGLRQEIVALDRLIGLPAGRKISARIQSSLGV